MYLIPIFDKLDIIKQLMLKYEFYSEKGKTVSSYKHKIMIKFINIEII